MMYPMQQEMQRTRPIRIRHIIIHMKQESMECIFEESPDDVSDEETCECSKEGGVGDGREEGEWGEEERGGGGEEMGGGD